MKAFMDQDYLLTTETARRLYHEYAQGEPIVDYHSHLSARDIAEDRHYRDLYEAMVEPNPFKARLMRAAGVEEKYITGRHTDAFTRFQKFAEVIPQAAGNPIYAWTHMELSRFFGIAEPLTPDTAPDVWEKANRRLAGEDFGICGLLGQIGVKLICTTEDAAADLKYYRRISEAGLPFRTVPALRLDKVLRIEDPQWENYMKYELGEAAGVEEAHTMQDVRAMLRQRVSDFDALGCRTADHVLDYVFFAPAEEFELDDIVGRIINGRGEPSRKEAEQYKTAVLMTLAKEYAKRDWVMQLRFAAIRGANVAMTGKFGDDAGFDCIGDYDCAVALSGFLNALSERISLPRMIVYSANPADQPVIASVLGAFQDTATDRVRGIPGKLQLGTACWFNMSRRALDHQMEAVANFSVLGTAVGMLADAHTPFSLVRHDYYRRILCRYLGKLVEYGEYPGDDGALGSLVRNICWRNAEQYFGFRI